jgi:hypothetical protein
MKEVSLVLHILNGDGLAVKFRTASVPGDWTVWREFFFEGPLSLDKGEDYFWRTRADYFSRAYDVPKEEYIEKMKDVQYKLQDLIEHDEITLWFDQNLSCQINLIYILKTLSDNCAGFKVNLVNVSSAAIIGDNYESLTPETILYLFEKREAITAEELDLGAELWEAYVSPSPEKFLELLRQDFPGSTFQPSLLEAHLHRFPTVKNGLSVIQNKLLNYINTGFTSLQDITDNFFYKESIYGLNDIQIRNYIKTLHNAHLVNDTGNLSMTKTGQDVLKGEINYIKLIKPKLWIGGIHVTNPCNLWCFNEDKDSLIKL